VKNLEVLNLGFRFKIEAPCWSLEVLILGFQVQCLKLKV
jgi:hypothetical protein